MIIKCFTTGSFLGGNTPVQTPIAVRDGPGLAEPRVGKEDRKPENCGLLHQYKNEPLAATSRVAIEFVARVAAPGLGEDSPRGL